MAAVCETKWKSNSRLDERTQPQSYTYEHCVNYEIHFQLPCILISAKTRCQPSFSKKAITFHMNTVLDSSFTSLYAQFIDQSLYAPISAVNTCVDRCENWVRVQRKGGWLRGKLVEICENKDKLKHPNWRTCEKKPKKSSWNNVSMQQSSMKYRWIQIEAVRCILLNIIVNAIWYFVIGHIQQIIVLYEYQKITA